MGKIADSIKELQEKKAKLQGMGGEKAVQKQHERGKLTARERLNLLFDPGSFKELDVFVRHRSANFDMPKTEIPSDGVIVGYGLVEGRMKDVRFLPLLRILPLGQERLVKCMPRRFARLWTWH